MKAGALFKESLTHVEVSLGAETFSGCSAICIREQ